MGNSEILIQLKWQEGQERNFYFSWENFLRDKFVVIFKPSIIKIIQKTWVILHNPPDWIRMFYSKIHTILLCLCIKISKTSKLMLKCNNDILILSWVNNLNIISSWSSKTVCFQVFFSLWHSSHLTSTWGHQKLRTSFTRTSWNSLPYIRKPDDVMCKWKINFMDMPVNTWPQHNHHNTKQRIRKKLWTFSCVKILFNFP